MKYEVYWSVDDLSIWDDLSCMLLWAMLPEKCSWVFWMLCWCFCEGLVYNGVGTVRASTRRRNPPSCDAQWLDRSRPWNETRQVPPIASSMQINSGIKITWNTEIHIYKYKSEPTHNVQGFGEERRSEQEMWYLKTTIQWCKSERVSPSRRRCTLEAPTNAQTRPGYVSWRQPASANRHPTYLRLIVMHLWWLQAEMIVK